jgi:uncharacterized DUF497 family protein
MNFEWDPRKNQANYAKHKINFELASKVFDDPLARFRFDRVIDGEERWLAIGKVLELHVLVVAHTYRNHTDQEVIRIISARRATSHERRLYEEK